MNEQVKKVLGIATQIKKNEEEILRLRAENEQLTASIATLVTPRHKKKPSKKVEDTLVRDVKKHITKSKLPPKRTNEEYERDVLSATKKPSNFTKIAAAVRTKGPTLRRVLNNLERQGKIERRPVTVTFGLHKAKREVEGWVATG